MLLTLRQATLDPHLHQRLRNTHRQSWLSLLWDHYSFLLGPGVHKVVSALQESLFPQFCGSSVFKSHWLSKSKSLWYIYIYIYIYISLKALLLKNLPTIQETLVKFLGQKGRKVPWRRDRLPTPIFMGFPGGSDGKEFNCNARDLDLIPWLGRSPRGGHGKSLQCSCLKSPLNKGGLVAYSPWGHKESAHRKHTRIHTYIYIWHIFNHSSIDGHLGCFHAWLFKQYCSEHWGACIFLN